MTFSDILDKAANLVLKKTHEHPLEIPLVVELPDGNLVPVVRVKAEPPPEGIFPSSDIVYILKVK